MPDDDTLQQLEKLVDDILERAIAVKVYVQALQRTEGDRGPN